MQRENEGWKVGLFSEYLSVPGDPWTGEGLGAGRLGLLGPGPGEDAAGRGWAALSPPRVRLVQGQLYSSPPLYSHKGFDLGHT